MYFLCGTTKRNVSVVVFSLRVILPMMARVQGRLVTKGGVDTGRSRIPNILYSDLSNIRALKAATEKRQTSINICE